MTDDSYQTERKDWGEYSSVFAVGEQIGFHLDMSSILAISARMPGSWWANGMIDGIRCGLRRSEESGQ